jgi:hypothetical protein
MFHIVFEDGYWSVWLNGKLVRRFHTKEEAQDYIRSITTNEKGTQ